MTVHETVLPGVLLLETRVFQDERGWFREAWHEALYREAGVDATFIQDNVSFSTQGVLRGLHFQNPHPQGKLVGVLAGEVFDVAVDIRPGSETFGAWVGETLSAENGRQLWIPPGFAHGFVVTGSQAVVLYKCTDFYDPRAEHCIRWDDPAIGIAWPVADPVLSARDRGGALLREVADDRARQVAPDVGR